MKPVIIGAGLAGLTVALALAPCPVIVLSPYKVGEECASAWAQGGIAAAVGKDDNASLHAKDTLAAGAGLCDPAIVRAVTDDDAHVIESLAARGVPFDRDDAGQLRLGLEAAHCRRRIVHAADATGATVMKTLVAAARATPSIEIIENAVATDLLTGQGAICGVALERDGERMTLPTRHVVLATGGAGALWLHTSNPHGSWGRGILLAAQVGAVLGDLEFMQFHPTCIDIGRDPMPLASEALRGEGCTLIDEKGERFVDELQPRDIVARAIWKHKAAGHRIFLDAREALGQNFAKRFPTVHALCTEAGFDPAVTPIPVSPGAHYHMGGVVTDVHGRTNVEGLWACGEVACTGLHGANRLASNSLLEAASFGRRVAEDIAASAVLSPSRKREGLGEGGDFAAYRTSPQSQASSSRPPSVPPARGGEAETERAVRVLMTQQVGLLRDAAGLQKAVLELTPLARTSDRALLGLMVAVSALRREESRGGHARTDFFSTDPAWQRHQHITLADILPLLQPDTPRHAAGV